MKKKYSTRYKPKQGTKVPVDVPSSDARISISTAVAFLASRCKPAYEDARPFKNKVSQRVRYAIKIGYLTEQGGLVLFADLMQWARTKKQYVRGLADIRIVGTGGANMSLLPMQCDIRGIELPTTIEECHAALLNADRRIADLESQLARAHQTLEEQRPYVETGRRVRRPRPRDPM